MKKSIIKTICFIMYSLLLIISSFVIGKKFTDFGSKEYISTNNEEVYTAKEKSGKLVLYKDGENIMSLDTNIDVLPAIVRSQLKSGVDFKLSELPMILEAFAE